jgi:phosphate transport system permease protein
LDVENQVSTLRRQIGDFTKLRYKRRKALNGWMMFLLVVLSLFAASLLCLVFGFVLVQALPFLNVNFFTQMPVPVGEMGGGMANAILGSSLMVGLGSLIGIPWGVMAGIYLSEYGKTPIAKAVRFFADMLASVPSIIVGLFVYVLVVKPMRGFSGFAGAIALAIIMVPLVARNTEELLKLVPLHIREAGLALGIPRWKVTLRIVVRGSISGLLTGVMLGIARIAGETAPLLFTALNNQYFSWSLGQPMASLPVQIYTYAISPFEEWNRQAWVGALVLVGFVFVLNGLTRWVMRRRV